MVLDPAMGGVRVYLVDEWADSVRRALVDEGGVLRWEEFSPGSVPAPTLLLDQRASDALIDGILAHARSRDGYVPTDARRDYLAERERVDRLIGVVADIAKRSS